MDRLHFDEAWYAYARFNPLYRERYAMHGDPAAHTGPTVFATHSTHKVLAALSQASFIHVREGRNAIGHARLNESFMMHSTTSPLYTIIASNDNRLVGVLQRIAICYLCAGLIFCYFGQRGRIVWCVGLLAGYWLTMTIVPAPHSSRARRSASARICPPQPWPWPPGRTANVPKYAPAVKGEVEAIWEAGGGRRC